MLKKSLIKERYLTVKECSVIMDVSIPTVYTIINSGDLPVLKTNSKFRVDSLELIKYFKKSKSNGEVRAIKTNINNYIIRRNKGLL